jgi:parallel beta-helix repeat protein
MKRTVSAVMLSLLVLGMLTLAFNIELKLVKGSTLTPHSPIFIDGDSGFVPANGVTGGSGTASDPYIMEGWDISASTTHGIEIRNTRAHFIIKNVLIHDGRPYGYSGIVFQNVSNGAILYIESSDNYQGFSGVDVSDTRIMNSTYLGVSWSGGIGISNSLNNTIAFNNLTNAQIGIGGNYTLVIGNRVTYGGNGIGISGYHNLVADNVVSNCGWYAIIVSVGYENIVTNNDASYSVDGIAIDGGGRNRITKNRVHHNSKGITVAHYALSSSDNYIIGNDVYSNAYGIVFEEVPSSGNFIYHNNLIDNTWGQAYCVSGAINTWDDGYPSGGNYWSNYVGVDVDGDGIGDAPYVIDVDNQDRYPLMHPWSPPTIRVAVLDSWGADVYDGTIFPWLNNEWSRYGLASIKIDYTSLNKEGISYGDIVLTKADVLIISHAYSGWDFTDSEINAIRRYVEEGHGLIGTYGTLIPENNRKLAELFGMNVSTNYGYPILSSGIFNILDVAHPLFASLPNPFIAPTVSETIYVPSHDWTFEGVTDGTILALTTDNEAAIIARSATYRSVYFTNQMEEKEVGMPETSIQAFYNAIVWAASPPQAYSLTITATVGGTTDPAPGTYTYTANSSVQVTAIPEANYLFDHWELDTINVGSANPYNVLMDKDHTLKAVFSPIPPPLSVSISPLSASILVGQSVTFTSTVSGGYTPYSYQWHLNGAPVSGATSNTWAFTPSTSGIYFVYLKVTDAKGNTVQSDAARITVATVPVGGYSIPIQLPATAKPLTPYIILTAILTIAFTTIKRKTTKKTKKPP